MHACILLHVFKLIQLATKVNNNAAGGWCIANSYIAGYVYSYTAIGFFAFMM